MPIPNDLIEIITVDPEVLGGTPCFNGTRVPLATFSDHTKAGISLERFLQGYSSVSREQALAVLEWHSRELSHSLGSEGCT